MCNREFFNTQKTTQKSFFAVLFNYFKYLIMFTIELSIRIIAYPLFNV